jgi:hypothetical protein
MRESRSIHGFVVIRSGLALGFDSRRLNRTGQRRQFRGQFSTLIFAS